MKRIIAALLSVFCALTAFSSCAFAFVPPTAQSSETESSHSSKKKEDMSLEEDEEESSVEKELEKLETYDEYDLAVYMKPIWQGSVVYNETVMFVGQNNKAPLLYKATEIVSVRSYDLETEYEEDVDYTFDKKTNSIKLTKNTSMPYFTEEEYYPSEEIPGGSFPCTLDNASYIRFSEGDFFSARQIAVTYRHLGKEHILAPKQQSKAFANTLQKLEQDKEVKILFYGDSITVGANSSGFVGCEPYADVWAKMVFDMLVKKTGASKAEYINTAVGGWTSQDGLNHLEEKVLTHAPDAVVLAFGMNDGGLSPTKHMANIKEMVARIRAINPDTEICLVSTMLPNEQVQGFYGNQVAFCDEYEDFIKDAKENGDDKICFANVTTMHSALLETKRYYDMTGNNVNHTNDFMARVYAQTVFQTIYGYEE